MSGLRKLLPSLNALVAFDAAVRLGTFANAAAELGVTGPAVSRAIARLESHLGLALFHRTPTGVILTEEGSILFGEVSRGFSSLEQTLTTIVKCRRPERRPVVLSVSAAFATHWFMPRLGRFQERFPDVEIRFQLINGPLAGPLDGVNIAMRFDPAPDSRSCVVPLMRELLLPICSPDFHRFESAAPSRTIRLHGSRFQWHDIFGAGGGDAIANEFLFSDYTLVVQAALMGQGNAVGWLNVVSTLLAEGALVPATPMVYSTGRRCDLVVVRSDPALLHICDWISAEYLADLRRIGARHPALEGALGIWDNAA